MNFNRRRLMMQEDEGYKLVYTTTSSNQTIRLISRNTYCNYLEIVETGERIDPSNAPIGYNYIEYTFPTAGDHEVKISIKEDITTFNVFQFAENLTEVDEMLFSKCTKLTDVSRCFYNCKKLLQIPSDIFINCPNYENIIDYSYCFNNCSSITSIPNLFPKNNNATNFNGCFGGITKNSIIPPDLFKYCLKMEKASSLFFQTNVKSITSIFSNNTELKDVSYCFAMSTLSAYPADLFRNNKKIENFSDCFSYCITLRSPSPTDADGGKLWQRQGKSGYPSYINGMNCFYECTGMQDYASVPSGWK